MGRASQQKKVSRAAGTGGGRTAGVRRPMGWYATLALVVVLGVFLVAFSRNQELNKGQQAAQVPPKINQDHWHSSFSVYICDHFMPNVPLFESINGIHTHGDGVIHVHPYTPQASGRNATLGRFLTELSDNGKGGTFKLSASEIKPAAIPGDTNPLDTKDWHNGNKCPDGQAGQVKFTVNGKEIKGDPTSWRLRNGDYLDVGFVDASKPLPSNPAEKQNLANINDVPTSTGTTTPGPSTTAPATGASPNGASPSTTAPPSTGSPPTTASPATTKAPTSTTG
ncbi:MAG TPA: hypothetical protein VMU14_22825 [Acidimicrobiales bacterium]|nr:hypothetical protein [Acidimicrobiales bacterium]